MAKDSKLNSLKRWLWYASLGVSLLLLLAGGGMLYYNGTLEGKQAFTDGRRLVVRLDNGQFDGFQADMPEKEDDKDKKAEDHKDEEKADEVKLIDMPKDKDKEDTAHKDEADKKEEPAKATAEENKNAASGHDDAKKEEHAPKADVKDSDKKAEEKPAAADEKKPEHSSADAEKKPEAEKQPEKPGAAAEEKAKDSDKADAHAKAEAEKKNEKPEAEPAKEAKVGAASDDAGEAVEAPAAAKKGKDTHADSISAVPSVTSVKAVNEALTETSKDGLLPKIGKDGTKPWKYYSKTAEYKGSYPVIAIIVTGLGTSKTITEQAIKLPENITLSFSPYARNVESWATAARATGHEVMLDLPLQPADYPASDPGPYGLLVDAKPEANDKKMQWLLSRFGAFIGVLTPLSDGFITDSAAFSGLIESVGKRGLLMVMAHDVVKDDEKKMVAGSKSPLVVADVIIDEDLSESSIAARLEILKQRARDKGFAVGIAQGYPISMTKLATLPEMCAKEGFKLMPASYVAKSKFK